MNKRLTLTFHSIGALFLVCVGIIIGSMITLFNTVLGYVFLFLSVAVVVSLFLSKHKLITVEYLKKEPR